MPKIVKTKTFGEFPRSNEARPQSRHFVRIEERPEPMFVPATARIIERPDTATRNPMREPDAHDMLQAMERVHTSRLNALLHPGSTEYSRAKAEVARLEGRIRAWYRAHPSLAAAIDADRGIV